MTERTRRVPEAPPLPPGRSVGEHHAPGGKFRNPWPPPPGAEDRRGGFLRWMWERRGKDLPPDPESGQVPHGRPDPAHPRSALDEIRITLIGHATFLLQIGGLNVLTDPIWTKRAGPFSLLGGPRFTGPGMALEDLPPLDGVLLSHGHYDHLDTKTVRLLVERFGRDLTWYTPLGYERWLRRRGVVDVVELDWWQESVRPGEPGAHGPMRVVCLPARHWSRRGIGGPPQLWASWAILDAAPRGAVRVPAADAPPDSGPIAPRGLYFGGDSGYCPAFEEIGRRLGPFRISLLPIGAYAPRWFMAGSHMDPGDAVKAYLDLGGRGGFVGMHWGAFRLSDEDPLEPPERTRAAWREAGLPAEDLHLPGIGETLLLDRIAPPRKG